MGEGCNMVDLLLGFAGIAVGVGVILLMAMMASAMVGFRKSPCHHGVPNSECPICRSLYK
jgi:hypothetical protein